MNNRFKFRGVLTVVYSGDDDEDKTVDLIIEKADAIYGGGIGFDTDQLDTAIEKAGITDDIEIDNIHEFCYDNNGCHNDEYFVMDGDIKQCTGLKDKNGNLIYEGDIVSGRYFNPYHPDTPNPKIEGVVCFVENRMTWIVENGDEGYDFEDCMEEYFEIIGNVYTETKDNK